MKKNGSGDVVQSEISTKSNNNLIYAYSSC